jgi:hypothetical protein
MIIFRSMKTLTIQQAARRLGMCPKTLSTVWVRRGIIKPMAGTTGQGRAMLFDSDTVQAFQNNADLAEFLALCRWGGMCGKGDTLQRAALYFGKWTDPLGRPVFRPWWKEFAFCEVYDAPRKAGGRLLYRHPHGWGVVPPLIQSWAIKACGVLSRREVECLCAIFIAAAVKPPPGYNETTFHAESDWVAIVAKRNSLSGTDLEAFDIDCQGLGLREVGVGDRFEGPLRRFCKQWFPEEKHKGMFRRLCAWVAMQQRRTKVSRRFPGAAAVGRVMHLQRAQAAQLVLRTLRKLHAAGVPNGILEPVAPSPPPDEDEDDYFAVVTDQVSRRGVALNTQND